MTFAMNNNVL